MLFNSYIFIFLFLPLTLIIFFGLNKFKLCNLSLYWLIIASLFFYGYWNPNYLVLILSSIISNFYLVKSFDLLSQKMKWLALALGILLNLSSIAYFKYFNFFMSTSNDLFETYFLLSDIILPLAISFFTFQQIAYLVDSYKQPTYKTNFQNYALFVLFFPQLIAGPIVSHKDLIPQFSNKRFFIFSHKNLAIGTTIFLLGLFKKVVIADQFTLYATPIFQMAESGVQLTIAEGWLGALGYALQLYFDFSGYSDMAIGLSKMFNLNLPINFNSPYQAKNIIEFWKRWHISLSYFLRTYLYIPLGGNRCSSHRKYINIFITMLLGGLWHGASWSFFIWGAMHGFMILINHLWHNLKQKLFLTASKASIFNRAVSTGFTFICVTFAWVVFRAPTLQGAKNMFKAMLGFNGLDFAKSLAPYIPSVFICENVRFSGLFPNVNFDYKAACLYIIGALLTVFLLPNTMTFFKRKEVGILIYDPINSLSPTLRFAANIRWLLAMGFIGIIAVLSMSKASEFLYFQF